MFQTIKKDGSFLRKPDFLALLIALVLMLVVVPLVENRFVAMILQETFLTAVFVTAIIANRDRRHLVRVGGGIGILAIALSWATVRIDHPVLNVTSYVSSTVFLATMAALILVSVLRDHMASMRAIFGAICVYLLIGLCWAMMYSALEQLQSEPFAIAHRTIAVRLRDGREATSYSQMVYFSFVTMTSLGYGDITPKTPAAQTLTWLQAVVGQLYITVLIARLVSVLPQRTAAQDGT
jgi:voltage-gated potassium channel